MKLTEKQTNGYFKNNRHFKEDVDASKLSALLKCKNVLKKYPTEWNMEYDCEKAHLTKILHALTQEGNDHRLIVRYRSSSKWGRVYPVGSLSLGSLRREIRHFLCEEKYWDIDMVNSHPNICVALCKQQDIECPRLME